MYLQIYNTKTYEHNWTISSVWGHPEWVPKSAFINFSSFNLKISQLESRQISNIAPSWTKLLIPWIRNHRDSTTYSLSLTLLSTISHTRSSNAYFQILALLLVHSMSLILTLSRLLHPFIFTSKRIFIFLFPFIM